MNNWAFFLPHAWLLLLSASVSFSVVFYAWRYRRSTGGWMLISAMLAIAVWCLFSALEVMVVSQEQKILFAKIEYIGMINAPSLIFLFVLQYTHQIQKPGLKILLSLWLIPLVTLGLVWTNELHHLVWTGFHPGAAANVLVYEHGPWYWVFTAFIYGLFTLMLLTLLQVYLSTNHLYRRRFLIMMIATAFPAMTGLVYVFNLSPVPGLDWTPVGTALTAVAIAWSTMRQKMLDLIPVAREMLIEQMREGAIVLDNNNRIVDANPAAEQLLGAQLAGWNQRSYHDTLPNTLVSVISTDTEASREIKAGADKFLELNAVNLLGRGGEKIGRLLSVRDISAWKQTQRKLEEANLRLTAQIEENRILQERLREEAIRDALTGLYNRRYMPDMIERELSRARRDNQAVGFLFIDLDNFKQINDRFGHAAGDQVIQRLGEFLHERTRREDFACRYGGEEFLIVLPGSSLAVCTERADEMRLAFSKLRFQWGEEETLSVTFSAGAAAFPQHGEDLSTLLAACDRAMYKAKSSGKNQVAVAS